MLRQWLTYGSWQVLSEDDAGVDSLHSDGVLIVFEEFAEDVEEFGFGCLGDEFDHLV